MAEVKHLTLQVTLLYAFTKGLSVLQDCEQIGHSCVGNAFLHVRGLCFNLLSCSESG